MNKNFMYGVGAVKYKDFVVGYIEKNSFDMAAETRIRQNRGGAGAGNPGAYHSPVEWQHRPHVQRYPAELRKPA